MYRRLLTLGIMMTLAVPACSAIDRPGCSSTNGTKRNTTMNDDKPAAGNKQDLVFTRTFDAPVERLWQAWTESKDVQQWWGPKGFTCPLARMEVRQGGVTLVCMRAPAEFGGQDMYSTWRYQRVVPKQQIEYIHNLADKDGKKIDPTTMGLPADFPQDQRHTVVFKPVGNGKTELTITEYGWTSGRMMEMSKLGMNQCLDKMAQLVEKK